MAESMEMKSEPRSQIGSRAARKLRKAGKIPGVIYGHGQNTISLSVSADDLEHAIRHGIRVVDLSIGGEKQKALLRDVQWDYLGMDVLHVDFYRITEGERVVVEVPIELRGEAPGAHEGMLEQPLHQIEVECLATGIPESIRVNISQMQLGDVIHVRDLKLPEGVEAKTDPDAVVVQIVAKEVVEEEEAAASPAEPEIIGRAKAEEEQEGE
ncbi:MAG: 50S ribosomal protein L25 [Gemmatales bacterium]|nr:MAG: 50S ribosomal protein L25 [Gemmatales bacterium]